MVNVLHRFHHLKTGEEGDVNFGFFTTFTDRLLGTAYYDKDRVIGSDDLGIAAQPNYPITYLSQLIHPLGRKKKLTTVLIRSQPNSAIACKQPVAV